MSERTVATITAASGCSPPSPALDVEELLGAEVRAETRFRDDDVGERERRARRENAVAAMRDVAERTRMNERRPAFERLHEIRTNRVLEQQRHGARRPQLARGHRTPRGTRRRADDDARQAAPRDPAGSSPARRSP